MNSAPFYKFPQTPYLIAPSSISTLRHDKILSDDEARLFFSEKVLIEEKIDGANLGISFQKDGSLCLQNRGHIISKPFWGQWEPLPNWLEKKIDILFDVLLDKYILFGEWCYVRHSVYYCELPDWFIAFDIFDKENHYFLSTELRYSLFIKMGVSFVPMLYEGYISKELLYSTIGKTAFGEEIMEGVYLRIDSKNHLRCRAKYVRPTFSQSIDTHWNKKAIVHNHLISYNR